eukprot:COSAG04_NODE_1456_length_6639_cov_83.154281_4_plen_79_part_00
MHSAASASAMAEEDVDLEWFKHKPFEEDYTVTRLLGEVSKLLRKLLQAGDPLRSPLLSPAAALLTIRSHPRSASPLPL